MKRSVLSMGRWIPRRNRAGFTLIEFIIYIAISSIMLVALLQAMIVITHSRDKVRTVSATQQELRASMDRMTTTIRDALDINTGTSVFGSDNGVLSLAMSGTTLNPTIFSLSSSHLLVKEGASAAVQLTSSRILVDQLRFTNLSAPNTVGTVNILLHATDATNSPDPASNDAMTLETAVSLRQ